MRDLKKKIILVAPAAGGKDFLKDQFAMKGLVPAISVTTRPMRDLEVDGETYHYVSEYIFDELKGFGAFYEAKCFNGWKYATTFADWHNADIFIQTPSGVASISEEDRLNCFVIFLDIPLEYRMERLMERVDADTMDRRIEADRKDFEGFSDYDMIVTQPNFNSTDVTSLAIALCQ